jgi:hypothetical protein
MTLTNEDMAVLKILVEKELDNLEKDGEEVMIINSPFLSGVSRLQSGDMEFLKAEKAYQEFLIVLKQKL